MEQFAWLGDGISDAAKRLLKKTLSLPSCASPGTTSPETRRAGSSVGPEGSAPWPEVKDQTDGLGTLWLGCPVLGLAQTHCPPPPPPRSLCSTFLSTARQTHTRSTPRPGCRHARRDGTHTHMRTRVCTHKLFTFPSPQRLLRPRRSLVPLSEHPSSSLASAEQQQRRGRESAGPAPAALPAALPASQPVLQPWLRSQAPRQRNRRNPKGIAGEDHEPPLQRNSPVPRGWCRRGPVAGEEAVKL